MDYPSLIFSSRPTGRVIDRDVFVDLKLSLLVGDAALDAMSRMCPPEDIRPRQEMFSALADGETRRCYEELAATAGEVKRLRGALDMARCDNERHYIYSAMICHLMRFYSAAAEAKGDGFFASRFREFFRDSLSDGRISAVSALCDDMRPRLEKVRVSCFRERGEELWVRRTDEVTIVERLKKCAEELGLKDVRVTRDIEEHLNPRIVNALALLFPEDFTIFKRFYEDYSDLFSEQFLRYGPELGFYIEISRLMDKVRALGMPVCMPEPSDERVIDARGVRDISLLAKEETHIVPNDALFTEEEPFFYLTGANGGGKTTYLRGVGIAVSLFLAGCPICADSAKIYPLEGVFTHFPRDERFDSEGRFADEQRRIKEIVARHGGNSLVLLNETYSTTSEELAVGLTERLAEQFYDSGSFGIYITHQHAIGESRIPFLSVIVDESDANRRTYRIARRRASDSSFAEDILRKYGMTEEALDRRFPAEGA